MTPASRATCCVATIDFASLLTRMVVIGGRSALRASPIAIARLRSARNGPNPTDAATASEWAGGGACAARLFAAGPAPALPRGGARSEEHTFELQSHSFISY